MHLHLNFIIELFDYDFFVNAFIAAIFASISCGIIGTYIVTRRMVFISEGIIHSSFGGIGICYYLGYSPLIGASIFSIFSAIIIEFLNQKTKIREDSAIAIMWSLGMAVGLIFVFLTPGYAPNLMSFLFGNILTVTISNIYLMIVITVLLVMFFIIYYRTILYISFDEEFASVQLKSTAFFKYLLICFVALIVVVNIKVVGVVLLLSLMTLPPTISNLLTNNFKKIIFYSILIGFLSSIIGLLASYYLDIPTGATIVVSLIILFILVKVFKYIQINILMPDFKE